jgi:IclR family acetate operon transcriptional repressor
MPFAQDILPSSTVPWSFPYDRVMGLLAGISGRVVGERLSIPTTSPWRILRVLRDSGYLLFDQERKTHRLSFKFLSLGNVLLNRMGFRSQARGYLKKIVELTGETAELSARGKDQLVLIDQVEGPEEARLFSSIGGAYPHFHATATGKVYLAI